jgi:hypothetical protein
MLESGKWTAALNCVLGANKTTSLTENKGELRRRTPLRLLIKDMPDMAAIVFDNCITTEGEKDDEKFSIQGLNSPTL